MPVVFDEVTGSVAPERARSAPETAPAPAPRPQTCDCDEKLRRREYLVRRTVAG